MIDAIDDEIGLVPLLSRISCTKTIRNFEMSKNPASSRQIACGRTESNDDKKAFIKHRFGALEFKMSLYGKVDAEYSDGLSEAIERTVWDVIIEFFGPGSATELLHRALGAAGDQVKGARSSSKPMQK
jgi:hypothetical protein